MSKRKTFLLRLSPDLYAALEAWAQQEMRSVNSQIEYLLREAVLRRQRTREIPPSSSGLEAPSSPDTPSAAEPTEPPKSE